MSKIAAAMKTALVLATVLVSEKHAIAGVSRDAAGWTVVTPSVDSRLIYVSSSTGNDSNSGLSPAAPKATIAAGAALIRTGFPDEMFLLCGDSWVSQPIGGYHNFSGRGVTEPILIGNYSSGACAAHPQLKTDGTDIGSFFTRFGSGVTAHVYFMGIDFYDAAKDPNNGAYTGTAPNTNGITMFDGGDDILVEDCAFRFLANGAVFQYVSGPSPSNITVRRSVIANQYNGSGGGHAQGMYWEGVVGVNTIEQNVFVHNGWNVAAGALADVFNHDLYIADSQNITVSENMLAQDSSLSLKFVFYGNEPTAVPLMSGITIFNNFQFEGEVGLGMAVQSTAACYTTSCIRGSAISYNVLSQIDRDNPTGRGLGWGMEIKDSASSSIDHNLFTDFSRVTNGNTFAVALTDDVSTAVQTNVSVHDNTAYRIHYTSFQMSPRAGWSAISVINNALQDPDQGAALEDNEGSFAAMTYTGNVYSPTNVAHMGIINGSVVSYAAWLAASSETGSQIHTNSYPDPGRSLDSYAINILGMPGGYAEYLTTVQTISKENWHTTWLAPAINTYIRQGFSLPDPPGSQGASIAYYTWGAILLFFISGLVAVAMQRARRRRALPASVDEADLLEAVRDPLEERFATLERELELAERRGATRR